MKFFKRKKAESFAPKVFPFAAGKARQPVSVQKPFDVYLFFTTLLLVLIGIMMIFSSSAILAKEKYGDTYYFLKKEMLFFIVGFAALFACKSVSYKKYEKWIYPLLVGTFLLMLITFIPGISHSAKGAARWIRFGGFTFQPSEFTKIVVVIFAAYLIGKKGEKIRDFGKGFLPVMAICGLYILMILAQKDLGSAFVLGSVILLLLFVAGTRPAYLAMLAVLTAPALYFLIFSVSFRKRRILAFLDPWKYQMDYGFQIIQSFVAFKSGGFAGVGLGESKQKLFYLPEAHTDFIFSVLGEEFGMLGVLIVMTLFLFFVARGLKIAMKTRDPFGMYLALGLTLLVGLEAFINFGVVMGILPTKGLALPFISYGGTSLIASLAAVGILLNVSTHTGEEM